MLLYLSPILGHLRNPEMEGDEQHDDYAEYLRDRQDLAFCSLQRESWSDSNVNEDTLTIWRDYMSDRHDEEFAYVKGPPGSHDTGLEDTEMESVMINEANRLEAQEYGAT